ncbi:MAG: FapA family protein [Nitrospirota bacterium]
MEQSQQEKKKKKKEDIEIEISPDAMKVFLQINSSVAEGSLIDVNIIMHKLWNAGVVHGIKGEVILQIIEQKIVGEPILVAEGKPSINGDDAIIDYRFTKALKPRLLTDLAGRVDYRDLGLIENVKRGEILATKRAATKGVSGITVTGKSVSARDGSDIPLPVGQNTEIIENGTAIISTANGYVVWKESKIGVETVYRVKGDVNMNVGNIHFIGTVEIDGDVREGFRVISEENVIINGGIDNATIRAEKNIEVKYGIRGKRGYIYAKGDLKSKFIENTTVEVKGDVIVSDAIIHSNVDAGGNVIVLEGKKGVIIGGRIRAGGEVNAKNIGSISEVLTEIEVGIDPSLRQEMLALEEMVEIEQEELREVKLKSNILTTQGKKDEALICLKERKELEESLKSGIEALNQIKKHIAANPAGKVSVVEQINPGVSLTIRTKTLLLKIDYKKITFIEKLGEIENLPYEEPTIKSKEDKGKKLAYWEREIRAKP